MTIKQAISAVVEMLKDDKDNQEYASDKARVTFIIEELRAYRDWITDDYEIKTEIVGGREMTVLPKRNEA